MFHNDALVYDTPLDECPSWSRATHAELEDAFRWLQDLDPGENEPGHLSLFHVSDFSDDGTAFSVCSWETAHSDVDPSEFGPNTIFPTVQV